MTSLNKKEREVLEVIAQHSPPAIGTLAILQCVDRLSLYRLYAILGKLEGLGMIDAQYCRTGQREFMLCSMTPIGRQMLNWAA